MAYIAMVFSAAAAIIWFFLLRRRELDKAPEQHQLASMLIAALARDGGVTAQTIRDWIGTQGWSRSRRSVRISHALRLAQPTVPEQHQAALLALARALIAAR
jgi:hypothetical protein